MYVEDVIMEDIGGEVSCDYVKGTIEDNEYNEFYEV